MQAPTRVTGEEIAGPINWLAQPGRLGRGAGLPDAANILLSPWGLNAATPEATNSCGCLALAGHNSAPSAVVSQLQVIYPAVAVKPYAIVVRILSDPTWPMRSCGGLAIAVQHGFDPANGSPTSRSRAVGPGTRLDATHDIARGLVRAAARGRPPRQFPANRASATAAGALGRPDPDKHRGAVRIPDCLGQ